MVMEFNSLTSEDDDSEDVVLQNSPLYKYLEETGFMDAHDKNPAPEKPKEFITKQFISIKEFKDKICYGFSTFFNNLFYAHAKTTQRKFAIMCIEHVIESSVLIEEDNAFLKDFASDTVYKDMKGHNWFSWAQRMTTPIIFIVLVKYFFLEETINMLFNLENVFCLMLWKSIENTIFFLTAFFLILLALTYIFQIYIKGKCNSIIQKLKELSYMLKLIIALFKKCLRIIQEAELISRGFTLVSVNGPIQRLELSTGLPINSPKRQHPELRKTVFSWVKETFLKHREATLKLMNSVQIGKDLDIPSHYLAAFSLEEFGPLLILSMTSEEQLEELIKVSDNFSLSSLKSVIHLMEVQISEYLKHFCLDAFWSCEDNIIIAYKNMKLLDSSLKDVVHYDENKLANVERVYHYYKSIEEATRSKNPVSPCSMKSPLHALNVAVHSLGLHLRAALQRVNSIEDSLYKEELHFKDSTGSDVEQTLLEKMKYLMLEIEAELSSSNDCFSESNEHLNNLFGEENPVSDVTVVASIENQLNNQSTIPNVSVVSNVDPEVEDEVFEAFISEYEQQLGSTNENLAEWFEQKEKWLKETEASAHMLRELKTVLVVKAEEHKLREEKALAVKRSKEIRDLDNTLPQLAADENEFNSNVESDKSLTVDKNLSGFVNLSQSSNRDQFSFQEVDDASVKESKEIKKKSVEECFDDGSDVVEHGLREPISVSGSTFSGYKSETDINKDVNDPSSFRYRPSRGVNFASSIAALAAERSKLLGLSSDTFVSDADEFVGNSSDDELQS